MPIRLYADELKPDMKLAGNLLSAFKPTLPDNWQLSDGDIEFLKKTCPKRTIGIVLPALDKIVEFQNDARPLSYALKIQPEIVETFDILTRNLKAGNEINEELTLELRHPIIKAATFMKANNITTALLTPEPQDERYLAYHTANVFYLSLTLGQKLLNYIKEQREQGSATAVQNAASLTPLALAAFFHDASLYNRPNPQHTENPQDKALENHPTDSAELFADFLGPMTRHTIRCHHEKLDQTGYPQKLPPEKINVYARILRVADAFCTIRAHNDSPALTLQQMMFSPENAAYDAKVLETLGRVIQPFQIGTRLKLSTGQTAVVTQHNPETPFSPTVIIAFEANGKLADKRYLKKPIDLNDRPDLHITAQGREKINLEPAFADTIS